jgi:HEAT repeat protein
MKGRSFNRAIFRAALLRATPFLFLRPYLFGLLLSGLFGVFLFGPFLWPDILYAREPLDLEQLYQEALYEETALGNPRRAIEIYRKVCKLCLSRGSDPRIAAKALLGQGRCHELLREYEKAIRAYRRIESRFGSEKVLLGTARERIRLVREIRAKDRQARKIEKLKKRTRYTDWRGKLRILWAIKESDDADFLPLLYEMLNDKELSVRLGAIAALGVVGDFQTAAILESLLSDPDERISSAALDALQTLNANLTTSSVAELISSLSTSNPYERYRIFNILRHMEPKRLLQDLEKHLDDPNPLIRYYAVILLGKKGDRSAIPKLKKRLEDPYAEIRCNAALSLLRLGDPSGRDRLIKDIAHPNPYIRSLAAVHLSHFGDASGTQVLLEDLKSREYFTRSQAIRSLQRLFGSTLGYRADDPPERRLQALKRWESHLRDWKKTGVRKEVERPGEEREKKPGKGPEEAPKEGPVKGGKKP